MELKFDAIRRQFIQQLSQIYLALSEWISIMSSKNMNELTIQVPKHGQINIAPQHEKVNMTTTSGYVHRRNKQLQRRLKTLSTDCVLLREEI